MIEMKYDHNSGERFMNLKGKRLDLPCEMGVMIHHFVLKLIPKAYPESEWKAVCMAMCEAYCQQIHKAYREISRNR